MKNLEKADYHKHEMQYNISFRMDTMTFVIIRKSSKYKTYYGDNTVNMPSKTVNCKLFSWKVLHNEHIILPN